MAYQRQQPLGMDRLDFYAGMIGASALNAMRGSNSKPVRWDDLIPWAERDTLSLDDQIKRQFGVM